VPIQVTVRPQGAHVARSRSALPAADLARTVVFAAFIAVLGIFPGVYVGGSAVPIVVQNMGPLLAGSILGARRGAVCLLLFLVLVALGFPVLSGGRGGLAVFAGPTGGFILGWAASAAVAGLLVRRALPRPGLPTLVLACVAGAAMDYLVGVPYWGAVIGDFGAAAKQSLVFLPGDAAKVVLAAVVAAIVHRALPQTGGPQVGARQAGDRAEAEGP